MTDAHKETLVRQGEASDPKASAWVTANAGTGKTHVLTQRVIRLLLDDAEPQRILCLTYTKSAAAQMQNRLFEILGPWCTLPDSALAEDIDRRIGERIEPDAMPAARRLFARALETPGGLKIQTIHAFCQHVLGRFPLEAGVAPDFEVLDERTAAELLAAAAAEVLEAADNDASLSHSLGQIVANIGEGEFGKILKEIVDKRSEFAAFLGGHESLKSATDCVAASLGLDPDVGEETVARALVNEVDSRRHEIRRAVDVLNNGSTNDQKMAAALSKGVDAKDAGRRLAGYFGAFLTQGGDRRKRLITADVARRNPDVARFLTAEQDIAAAAHERLKAARVYEASAAVLAIAEHFLTEYERGKAARAALDYDDLILKARDLVTVSSDVAWVLYKLDGGIDHILIDEAQDTSPAQWDVIARLADEFFAGQGAAGDLRPGIVRTVFAVGDEKQSIFSFQGADPAKFHEMRNYFHAKVEAARLKWASVDLILSFRSVEIVLETVDRLFATPHQARALTPSGDPVAHRAKRLGEAGLVELWPLTRSDKAAEPAPWDAPLDQETEGSPRALLAQRIVATIKSWIEYSEVLESEARPIRPGDILILVRRRDTLAEEIIRQLKNCKVDVAGADRMVLAEQISVMDLTAIGAFALLPEDDLTLAVVLKSPLIGLGEEALYDLAYARTRSLWQTLIQKARSDKTGPYAAAHAALAHVLARADVVPPYEFYEEILDRPFAPDLPGGATGRQRLLARLGRDAEDPIDEFLGLALTHERAAVPSLQGFLHWLQQGRSELKREHDHGRDEVRVMTVHGAKGLESPIVFLPDTCGLPDGHHDPMLVPLDDDMLVWPVRRANDVESITAARADLARDRLAEYHRLFYVAATRARDRLYIAGYATRKDLPTDCWYRMAESAIKPYAREVALPFGETGWRVESRQTKPPKRTERPDTGRGDAVLPGWIATRARRERAPEGLLSPSSLSSQGEAFAGEPSPLSPMADGERLRRGVIVHKLLEILPSVARSDRDRVARDLVRRTAPNVDDAATETLIAEVGRIIDHRDFAELFGPNARAEVALAGSPRELPQRRFSGRVDRMVIGPDRVLVVDYKTDRPAPATVEEASRAYIEQMSVYRSLIKDIYTDKRVSCALLWTAGPLFMPLADEILDDAIRRLARTAT